MKKLLEIKFHFRNSFPKIFCLYYITDYSHLQDARNFFTATKGDIL